MSNIYEWKINVDAIATYDQLGNETNHLYGVYKFKDISLITQYKSVYYGNKWKNNL